MAVALLAWRQALQQGQITDVLPWRAKKVSRGVSGIPLTNLAHTSLVATASTEYHRHASCNAASNAEGFTIAWWDVSLGVSILG